MNSLNNMTLGALVLTATMLAGCEDLVVHDPASLLAPRLQRSEIVGLVAGAGTTFAALPDLIAMLKRRSSKGMNPRMAGLMGIFQIGWIYYGLLIASRPVTAWNLIGVAINFLTVGAYRRFARRDGLLRAGPAVDRDALLARSQGRTRHIRARAPGSAVSAQQIALARKIHE